MSSRLAGGPCERRGEAHARRGGGALIAILGGPTKGNLGLVAGLRRLGLDTSLVAARDAGERVGPGDMVVARLDVLPSLDGVEEGLLELLWLERRGIRTVNSPRALLAAHDKLRSWRLLARRGVPQPRTVHVRSDDDLWALDLPLVVKPRFGSWGRDVVRCRDPAELGRCLAGLRERPWFRRHGAIAQELLPPRGVDLRLVVAAGEVVGAVERLAAPGEWRTNVSLGGTIRPVSPPPEVSFLAREAASAVDADLVGVDVVPTAAARWVVLELNGSADFDWTYSFAGRDVYADLASALALGGVEGPVGGGASGGRGR